MGLPRIACMFMLHTGKETVFTEAFARVDAVHGQLQFFFLQRNTSLKYECMRCYPQVNTVYLQLEGCRNTINFDNTKKSGDLILYNMPVLHYTTRHSKPCLNATREHVL